jgi:hypothetical protein
MHRTGTYTGAPKVRQKLAPVHQANNVLHLQKLSKL